MCSYLSALCLRNSNNEEAGYGSLQFPCDDDGTREGDRRCGGTGFPHGRPLARGNRMGNMTVATPARGTLRTLVLSTPYSTAYRDLPPGIPRHASHHVLGAQPDCTYTHPLADAHGTHAAPSGHGEHHTTPWLQALDSFRPQPGRGLRPYPIGETGERSKDPMLQEANITPLFDKYAHYSDQQGAGSSTAYYHLMGRSLLTKTSVRDAHTTG